MKLQDSTEIDDQKNTKSGRTTFFLLILSLPLWYLVSLPPLASIYWHVGPLQQQCIDIYFYPYQQLPLPRFVEDLEQMYKNRFV